MDQILHFETMVELLLVGLFIGESSDTVGFPSVVREADFGFPSGVGEPFLFWAVL